MLPATVAKLYPEKTPQMDLPDLCNYTLVEWKHGKLIGLDPERKVVIIEEREENSVEEDKQEEENVTGERSGEADASSESDRVEIPYDILSLNIGSRTLVSIKSTPPSSSLCVRVQISKESPNMLF